MLGLSQLLQVSVFVGGGGVHFGFIVREHGISLLEDNGLRIIYSCLCPVGIVKVLFDTWERHEKTAEKVKVSFSCLPFPPYGVSARSNSQMVCWNNDNVCPTHTLRTHFTFCPHHGKVGFLREKIVSTFSDDFNTT